MLSAERDSLRLLLENSRMMLEKAGNDLEAVKDEKSAIETRNRVLAGNNVKKDKIIKETEAEKNIVEERLNAQIVRNDSLKREYDLLEGKLAGVEKQISETQNQNSLLGETIRQKEEKIKADSIAEANKPVPPKENGFINITEAGYGFGMGNTSVDYSKSVIHINNVFGYEINNHFLTGIGTGLNIYNGGMMIPLYIDIRYTMKGQKLKPYFFADGGVLLNLDAIESSGIFINPGIGAGYKLNEKMSLTLNTGFILQEAPSGMRNSYINIKAGLLWKGKR
jgi:hypothetical protein